MNIPRIGFGLWQVNEPIEFKVALEAALAAGYRHFDSAQAYGNEALLGRAWRASELPRDDLFLTTKIGITSFGTKRTPTSFATSLKKLQTDYVDLLLLHFPVPIARKAAWLQLEKIKAAGRARTIGVSNYTIRHLEEMKSYANEMPAVNQVELHVFLQQPELLDYCRTHDITVEAYSPLAHGKAIDDPVLAGIANKHGKSSAQIMLRWCLQNDLVVLPKSTTPARIAENINIFDFELDDTDMKTLATLDKNLRTCWDPTFVP